MAELYAYYTALYQKFSGLWRQYNTYSTVMTNHMRDPLYRSVSYWPNPYSDPALLWCTVFSLFTWHKAC